MLKAIIGNYHLQTLLHTHSLYSILMCARCELSYLVAVNEGYAIENKEAEEIISVLLVIIKLKLDEEGVE